MHNVLRMTTATLSTILMCSFSQPNAELVSVEDLKEPIPQTTITQIEAVETEEDYTSSPPVVVDLTTEEEPIAVINEIPIEEEPVEIIEEPSYGLTEEEIELIALVTMAEAEGESDEGKRLVIDTILNRVDSEIAYFPDTVSDVIYQPSQFSSMWNGRVDRCYVDDYICQLVKEELESRTNSDVMYFHANKYGKYGTPMFAEGNHYFSSV